MELTTIQEKVPLPPLERFFKFLTECAGDYKWQLVPHGTRTLIRSVIDKVPVCPVQVVAYHRSGKNIKERDIPPNNHRASMALLTHAGDACIVMNADEIETSRYYRPEVRERLLKAVGLVKKTEETTAKAEPVVNPQ